MRGAILEAAQRQDSLPLLLSDATEMLRFLQTRCFNPSAVSEPFSDFALAVASLVLPTAAMPGTLPQDLAQDLLLSAAM